MDRVEQHRVDLKWPFEGSFEAVIQDGKITEVRFIRGDNHLMMQGNGTGRAFLRDVHSALGQLLAEERMCLDRMMGPVKVSVSLAEVVEAGGLDEAGRRKREEVVTNTLEKSYSEPPPAEPSRVT